MPTPPNPEYMEAAEKNMAPPMPPSEEPPPEEAPAATLQLTLTENAIAELSKPENKEELEKLKLAGIIEEVGEGGEMPAAPTPAEAA